MQLYYLMESVLYIMWTLMQVMLIGNLRLIYSQRVFPSTENEKINNMIALTKNFLVLLEVGGRIRLYHLQD